MQSLMNRLTDVAMFVSFDDCEERQLFPIGIGIYISAHVCVSMVTPCVYQCLIS